MRKLRYRFFPVHHMLPSRICKMFIFLFLLLLLLLRRGWGGMEGIKFKKKLTFCFLNTLNLILKLIKSPI